MDVTQLDGIKGSLWRTFDQWKPWFKDLSKSFDPNRQRFDLGSTNRHLKYNHTIIDPTVTMAVRTGAGGLQSGVTNPAVPWIRLETADPDLNNTLAVKQWLYTVSELILDTLARSNFYNVAPMMYKDFLVYSTMNAIMMEDSVTDIRFYHQPIGTYSLGNDERYEATMWTRDVKWTAQQIVKKYGKDKVPSFVMYAFKQNDMHSLFTIHQLVMPREYYDPGKKNKLNKKFASYQWISGVGSDKALLDEGGMDNNPIITARWEQLGNDAFGSFGPGMLGLGSAKGLQKDTKNKFLGQDLMLDPPMNMPMSMQGANKAFIPGARYYGATDQVKPASTLQYPINYALESIQDTRQIIKSVFFNDLFLMIANVTNSGVTATEIAEKKEEKLLMLGPVLSRINEEFLDPVVTQTFYYLNKHGKIPPAPPAMEGTALNIRYISMLHQAQQLVSMTAIEKSVSFVGNLMAADQSILDNINLDKAAKKYFSVAGLDPELVNDDDVIQQKRQQRAQQQSAQQNAQLAQPAQQAAQAAKLLSETDSGGQNALDLLRERMGAAMNG